MPVFSPSEPARHPRSFCRPEAASVNPALGGVRGDCLVILPASEDDEVEISPRLPIADMMSSCEELASSRTTASPEEAIPESGPPNLIHLRDETAGADRRREPSAGLGRCVSPPLCVNFDVPVASSAFLAFVNDGEEWIAPEVTKPLRGSPENTEPVPETRPS